MRCNDQLSLRKPSLSTVLFNATFVKNNPSPVDGKQYGVLLASGLQFRGDCVVCRQNYIDAVPLTGFSCFCLAIVTPAVQSIPYYMPEATYQNLKEEQDGTCTYSDICSSQVPSTA